MHHTSTIPSHPAIEVRALSTLSPTQAVLRQVSFSVDNGTVALLIGPDTAAHTTLLQLLAGRLSPTGGRVRICGLDVRTARLAAAKRTGHLPAQAPDCGHMRVADILGFAFKARALSQLNRRAEAIQVFREAVKLYGGSWEGHFELAGELAAVNEVAEAIREYQEAVRLNPNHAVARVNLGVMLVRQNRGDEALQQFELALRSDPNNVAAKEYLSQVMARKNQSR